jgi:hypothetical protein
MITGYRHQKLEQSEMKGKSKVMSKRQFFYFNSCCNADRKRIHGKAEGKKDRSGKFHK